MVLAFILAALTLQDAGAHRRQRIGARDRRDQRRDGDAEGGKAFRKKHVSSPLDELNVRGTGRKRRVENMALRKEDFKTSNACRVL